jgi:hypothetical protein
MPDLDDEVVTVTIPLEEGAGTITKIEGDGGAAKSADEADPIADLKGQFETLKGTLGQTTQRLAGAERQLVVKDQEIAEVRGQVVESQLDTVTSGIAAAEAEAASAEAAFIAAAEAGDFTAQAKAQRKISAAETRIQRLTEAKADLEDAKPAKITARTEASPERQAQQDPVEAVASGMAPRAAAWIRSHPECITDKAKNSKMMATHYAALADGLEEGGNDYFARLDAMVNVAPVKLETKPAAQQSTNGTRPMSAAASGAGAGGGMNGGGTTVTLTRREVEAATDGSLVYNFDDPNGKFKKNDPIGIQEFGRRKAALTKQGAYDRSYNES